MLAINLKARSRKCQRECRKQYNVGRDLRKLTPIAMALSTNLFNAAGLVAVVTGGGSGRHSPEHPITHQSDHFAVIGLMMARALEANGAVTVYVVGRRMEVTESRCQAFCTSLRGRLPAQPSPSNHSGKT